MNLSEKMNKYLCDQQVMFVKLHNIHWYIQGKSFFTLHEKTEELYNKTAIIIDEVAERMLSLGYKPIANLKETLSNTSVNELGSEPIDIDKAVSELLTDVKYWINDTKEVVALAEGKKDTVTADMFNGYLEEYEKLAWMLDAYSK